MDAQLDVVARYGASQGFKIARRTVLVEGTTDVALFERAASRSEGAQSLIGDGFAVVAAGIKDRGGASGVIRELITLRQLSRTVLDQSGAPKYRFVALVDGDQAGASAVRTACGIDASIIENRDIFRLHPIMPVAKMAEPGAIGRELSKVNAAYRGLKWEIEDAVSPSLMQAFLEDYPNALIRQQQLADRVHWELSDDGKARFHRFLNEWATDADLTGVRDVLLALRSYLNVK